MTVLLKGKAQGGGSAFVRLLKRRARTPNPFSRGRSRTHTVPCRGSGVLLAVLAISPFLPWHRVRAGEAPGRHYFGVTMLPPCRFPGPGHRPSAWRSACSNIRDLRPLSRGLDGPSWRRPRAGQQQRNLRGAALGEEPGGARRARPRSLAPSFPASCSTSVSQSRPRVDELLSRCLRKRIAVKISATGCWQTRAAELHGHSRYSRRRGRPARTD